MARKTVAARVRDRAWTACRVPDCPNLVDALSRFCNGHKIRAKRHGSPLGRALRATEVAPYRVLVSRFVDANARHPALLAVFGDWDRQLSTAAATVAASPTPARLAPRDTRRRRLQELAWLHADGISGRGVFQAAAAVWLLSYERPGTVAKGRPLAFACARAVLGLRTRVRHRWATLVLAELGAELLDYLGPVLRAMADAVTPGVADFKSESVADFKSESVADFKSESVAEFIP